jgi:hypothetical protein
MPDTYTPNRPCLPVLSSMQHPRASKSPTTLAPACHFKLHCEENTQIWRREMHVIPTSKEHAGGQKPWNRGRQITGKHQIFINTRQALLPQSHSTNPNINMFPIYNVKHSPKLQFLFSFIFWFLPFSNLSLQIQMYFHPYQHNMVNQEKK